MQDKFSWITDNSRRFMNGAYIQNQTAEERYYDIATRFEEISGIPGFRDKVYDYFKKGWISLATPVLSHFGKNTGLPASCNMLDVQDTIYSILSSEFEMGMLASNGAGTARNFSNIRPKGTPYRIEGKSEGAMSWIASHNDKIKKVSQGVRRGFFTAGLSVEHAEINDFLTVGREGSPLKGMTTYVTIPEGWMESFLAGDLEKRNIFKEIHASRAEVGYPYILFEDNCNKNKAQVYKDKGLHLNNTNICSECIEYTDAEKEFLCVLSSLNLLYFDDWKDTDLIFDINIMLDCVTSEYISKAKDIKGHEKAVKFAEEHRAIGVGVLGFHSLLKNKNIVFGEMESHQLNNQIFSLIEKESLRSSKWMAENWGEPEMLKGYGLRNTSRIAVAPTKSTANGIMNVSSSIEADKNNYHTKDLAKIQVEWRDPFLEKVLEGLNSNTEEVWDSILENGGSVQHLYFLPEHTKKVFRTSTEISQMDIISLAASRAKYIDQSQSLNLFIPKGAKAKDIYKLTVEAWRAGLKTLYYQYNVNASQEFTKNLLTCSSCEG